MKFNLYNESGKVVAWHTNKFGFMGNATLLKDGEVYRTDVQTKEWIDFLDRFFNANGFHLNPIANNWSWTEYPFEAIKKGKEKIPIFYDQFFSAAVEYDRLKDRFIYSSVKPYRLFLPESISIELLEKFRHQASNDQVYMDYIEKDQVFFSKLGLKPIQMLKFHTTEKSEWPGENIWGDPVAW